MAETDSLPTTQQHTRVPRRVRRRRVFTIGGRRVVCSQQTVLDWCVDTAAFVVEKIVYLLGPILICLALSIIGLMSYSFFTILVPMMKHKHPDSVASVYLHMVWVAWILFNILFNYACCVLTKHNDSTYQTVVRQLAIASGMSYPETTDDLRLYKNRVAELLAARVRGNSGARAWMLLGPYEWGYCNYTNTPKPPRSHYDHVSQQLILNLDHYCPWMFNASTYSKRKCVCGCVLVGCCPSSGSLFCFKNLTLNSQTKQTIAVGYLNYRYFLNFLLYIFLGMFYGSIISWEPFFLSKTRDFRIQMGLYNKNPDTFDRSDNPMMPIKSEKIFITLCFMLCVAVGIAIAVLGGFHLYLTVSGQTTIEFHAHWNRRRRDPKFKNPYSVGSYHGNFLRVYGNVPFYKIFAPSRRLPEYLPVPIPDHSGLRRDCQAMVVREPHGQADELDPLV